MPLKQSIIRRPVSTAFTLIELLIVVAIIAILAAIAVPNFLEAQTRSKVSRTLADMRSLTTALETYRIDYNRYMPTLDPDSGFAFTHTPRIKNYRYLTTPVAYITSAFPDVFNTNESAPSGFSEAEQRVLIYWGPDFLIERSYPGVSYVDNRPRTAIIFQEFPQVVDAGNNTVKQDELWALLSYSPDQDFDVLDGPFPQSVQQYDPTNGTVSDGDVVRFRE